jgi:hypothetical protein
VVPSCWVVNDERVELRSHLELKTGSILTTRFPAGEGEVFGPDAFSPGQGFTVRSGTEVWRGLLLSATVDDDGRGAVLEIEMADRTPVAYATTRVR